MQEVLRTAMAMGADKAIHVEVDPATYNGMQPMHVAKILAKIAQENKIDLVLVGKQVICYTRSYVLIENNSFNIIR